MIITCPRCFATYDVPPAALAGERTVRCSSCRFEWKESPPPAEAIAGFAPEPEPQPAQEPEPQPVAEPEPQQEPQPEPVFTPAPVVAPAPAPVAKPAAKAASEKPSAGLGSGKAWAVATVITLACLLVLFRGSLGSYSTRMADFYETIGLPVEGPDTWFRFEGVHLERADAGNQLVFNIQGSVVNQSRREREVPLLKLFWLSSRGSVGPMVVLKAADERLPIGGKTTFTGQLRGMDASKGGEVKVTFLSAQEATFLKPGQVKEPTFRAANPPPAAPAHAAPAHAPAPPPEPAHSPEPAQNPAPAPTEPHPATPSPESGHESPIPPAQHH